MSHAIDHSQLRKAADLLFVIDDAGYGIEFDRELHELTDGDDKFRSQEGMDRWRLGLAGNAVDRFAKRLSAVLDAPLHQCRGIALEMFGHSPRRQIALELISKLAGQVQRLQEKESKAYRAGRRSA